MVKKIGTGTYGSAYLVCLRAAPSEQFVLKKVKIEDADDKERAAAETEVKVLSQLQHPFVLRYARPAYTVANAGPLPQLACVHAT